MPQYSRNMPPLPPASASVSAFPNDGSDDLAALMELDPEVRAAIIELQQENMDLSASMAKMDAELELVKSQLLRTQTERDGLRDQLTSLRLSTRNEVAAVSKYSLYFVVCC
jgi:septal ring factor EnvC (AmiA/AmiB activator)